MAREIYTGDKMLNRSLKKESIEALNSTNKDYENNADIVGKKSIELMNIRVNSANELIPLAEEYINSIANSPKEFSKAITEYKASYTTFNKLCETIGKESDTVNIKAGVGIGAGVAAGVGVAAFAPAAAMGIATTFGVASTGTAISALSGAAATNAALAWLGGGALAAGGGGMLAGNALLALSGPVGWAIGGASLAGAAIFSSRKNKQIAEEANKERKKIEILNKSLLAASKEITIFISLTIQHSTGVKTLLNNLKSNGNTNYNNFSESEKDMIGSLVNHILALSELINKKVDA